MPILPGNGAEFVADFIVRPVPAVPGLAVDVGATITAAAPPRLGVFLLPGTNEMDWWSDLLLMHYAMNDHVDTDGGSQLEADFEQALQPVALKIQTLLQKPIPSTEWITEIGTGIEGGLRIKARVNSKKRDKKKGR